MSGTLALRDDGRWVLSSETREVCGDRVETETDTEDGTYTLDGDAIQFRDDDGDVDADRDEEREIDYDDLSTGTRTADSLTVRLEDGRTTLLFRS